MNKHILNTNQDHKIKLKEMNKSSFNDLSKVLKIDESRKSSSHKNKTLSSFPKISRHNSPIKNHYNDEELIEEVDSERNFIKSFTLNDRKTIIRKNKLMTIFPNLKHKIKRVYEQNQIIGDRMNNALQKLQNFDIKIEKKINSYYSEKIKNDLETIKLINIVNNSKNSYFKAIKPKKKAIILPNETIPFSLKGQTRRAISDNKEMLNKDRKNNRENHSQKNKQKQFHSPLNFNINLKKPIFFKNFLECCDNIETDNNKMTIDIRTLKTKENFSNVKSLLSDS